MELLTPQEIFNNLKWKDKAICKCYHCKKEFEVEKRYILRELRHKRGINKFCSLQCSSRFNLNKRLITTFKSKIESGILQIDVDGIITYNYKCDKCGDNFTDNLIRKERKKTCKKCRGKRTIKKLDDINNLYEISSRTAQKILKKINLGCSNCGWNRGTCDIHHINGRKIIDANNHNNLTLLCPNCHRLVHEKKLDKSKLVNLSNYLPINWKDYYGLASDKIKMV